MKEIKTFVSLAGDPYVPCKVGVRVDVGTNEDRVWLSQAPLDIDKVVVAVIELDRKFDIINPVLDELVDLEFDTPPKSIYHTSSQYFEGQAPPNTTSLPKLVANDGELKKRRGGKDYDDVTDFCP